MRSLDARISALAVELAAGRSIMSPTASLADTGSILPMTMILTDSRSSPMSHTGITVAGLRVSSTCSLYQLSTILSVSGKLACAELLSWKEGPLSAG